MSELNQSILLAVECPCCLEPMTAPTYSCSIGHTICARCTGRLRKCPKCQSRILNTRNYCLEAIAELLHYPCPNTDGGCKMTLKKADLKEHATTLCSFRPYRCHLTNDDNRPCKWTGQRTELADHALKHHETKSWLRVNSSDRWRPMDSEYEIQMVFAHDQTFYLHRKLIKTDLGGVMYWALQYIGNSEDVIQYSYQIHIFSEEYSHRDILMNEICHDDVKALNEIIESGICIAIPLRSLESFKNKFDEVWYDITIKMT